MQEALETMACVAGSYAPVFTPYARVTSAPAEGALTSTRLAHARRCARAASAEVKRPVASSTISTPRSAQGRCSGSRSASTLMRCPSTTRVSPSTATGRPRRPSELSNRRSRASASGAVRSLTATTSRSLSRSSSARRVLRPIRPNPLMAMRVMMIPFVFGLPPCSTSARKTKSGREDSMRKDLATLNVTSRKDPARGAAYAEKVRRYSVGEVPRMR